MDFDVLPECFKNQAVEVGQVLEMEMGLEDNITPKRGTTKLKRFVVIAHNKTKTMLASLIINSKINENYKYKIEKYQCPVFASENNYLEHDSYINGYYIVEFDINRIKKEAKYLGRIKEADLKTCIKNVQSSPNIKKYILERYNLLP